MSGSGLADDVELVGDSEGEVDGGGVYAQRAEVGATGVNGDGVGVQRHVGHVSILLPPTIQVQHDCREKPKRGRSLF